MDINRNDQLILFEELMSLACHNKYDELEDRLDEIDTDSNIHDIIARIAIKSKDTQLFILTNHHPRVILEEYADNNQVFPFILHCYRESGFVDYTIENKVNHRIPEYIWKACTYENALLLADCFKQTPTGLIINYNNSESSRLTIVSSQDYCSDSDD